MVRTETNRLDEQKWCPNCKEVVDVDEYVEYEDGHVFYLEHRCANCGEDGLEDYHECPVCGELISNEDEFCEDCRTDIKQTLTEFMESHEITVDVLEDLVANHFGW